jgi:cyclic pyranopterin phosphate synthase
MNEVRDNFHRAINYMRVSVTDRCNLRCIYCMPPEGLAPIEHKEILSYEEMARLLKVAARMGLRKIRITGGEPLIRKNLPYLIRLIKSIEGIDDLSLTTNGTLLEQYAYALAEAGLDRVNISLDSLIPARYGEITRGGNIEDVFRGIAAAQKAGLTPIKINMVPVRGVNDDEIADFAVMAMEFPYQVRFIEFMPLGAPGEWTSEKFIPSEEVRCIVERMGRLSPAKLRKAGPARYFRLDGAAGVIGFISPLSNHFCDECNRLRLTADGKLRPCLFSETEIDLKSVLRSRAADREIERLIRLAVAVKPRGHNMKIQNAKPGRPVFNKKSRMRPMSRIGG